MEKVTAFVSQGPERLGEKKGLSRLLLGIVVVAVAAIGLYTLINSSAASDPNLLFNGTQINQYDNQSAPGAVSLVPDPLGSGQQVIKFVVSKKDVAPITPTENPRAQLLSPDLIKNGDDVWLKTKFLLPNDFPSNIPGWMSLASIYGPPFSGSSPWQISVDGNAIHWQRNDTYGYDIPWTMGGIVKNKWVNILLHEKFASDGFVEMWVDGKQITFFPSGAPDNPNHVSPTTRLMMQTMDKSNKGGANAAKIMQYREAGMFDSVTSYSGPLIIGKTQTAVDAADAANSGSTAPPPTTPTPSPPAADTTKPTVNITSPTSGSNVSGQVALAANASDTGGVTKVEFYADGTLVGTDTSAPYTASWNTANGIAGAHTLTAKAYDGASNVGTSAAVVVNTAPATTPSQLSFNSGGFESGNLNNWNIAGVGDVVPTVVSDNARSGSKSAKVILTGTQDRSELILGGNGSGSTQGTLKFNQGDDRYYSFSFYINQMVYGKPGGHNAIMQLKGDGDGSPALALYLWDTSGKKGLWTSLEGSNAGTDRFDSPVSEKQWHDVVVHFVAANTNSGSYQIFLDGKLVDSMSGINTLPTGVPTAYIKTGLYRNGDTVSGTSDIRIDGGKIGTTYASVAEASSPIPAVDTTAPDTTITAKPEASTLNTSPSFSFTSSESGSSFECKLDNGAFAACTSPKTYTGLTVGSHTFTVRAIDSAGNVDVSPATYNWSITAPPAAPKPTITLSSPTNGSTVSGIVTTTALVTAKEGDITKVEFLLDSNSKLTDTTSPYNYSFDSKNVTNGSHTLTAKAYGAADSIITATATITVSNPDMTPPSAPANLKASASNASTVSLTWSASSDSGANATGVKKYTVLRDGVVIAQPTTTSYTDNNRTADTMYSYVIQAIDGANNVSASSSTATVKTPAVSTKDTTAPTKPSSVKAVAASTSQINLTWNASSDGVGSGVAGYNVYRDGNKINTRLVTTTSYGDTGLKANDTYSYKIEAVDATGNKSGKSSVVTATTKKAAKSNSGNTKHKYNFWAFHWG